MNQTPIMSLPLTIALGIAVGSIMSFLIIGLFSVVETCMT